MAVAATIKMDEFQPENESIEAYLERIEIYFDVNGVADDKKVSVFLNALGGKTYTLLRNILDPAKLNTKSPLRSITIMLQSGAKHISASCAGKYNENEKEVKRCKNSV